MCVSVTQKDTEGSCKHQRKPNLRDKHAVYTASFLQQTALIWYGMHIISTRAAGGWALGTTQTTAFTMNNPSNPKKIQHEYTEELAELDAGIIALLLLPRWISRHSECTWCGSLAAIFPVGSVGGKSAAHMSFTFSDTCNNKRKTTHKSVELKTAWKSFMNAFAKYGGLCFMQRWLIRRVLLNNGNTLKFRSYFNLEWCPSGNFTTEWFNWHRRNWQLWRTIRAHWKK